MAGGAAVATASSSRGRTSTRQPRNSSTRSNVVDLDEDDAASASSSILAEQLRERLREMRKRVDEKQRHVSSILNSVASAPIVFSLFDQQANGSVNSDDEDDESSQYSNASSDSLPPMKEQDHPISIQGTASSSTQATTIPYQSTSSGSGVSSSEQSHSNMSSPFDLESGGGYGGGGEGERGSMEQQHWEANLHSSQRTGTPRTKTRSSRGANKVSNDIAHIAPVPVVNTTRDVADHDNSHGVVVHGSTSTGGGKAHHHHLRCSNKEYAHMTSTSFDRLDDKKKMKKSDDHNNEDKKQQQQHARSLTVPTGDGNNNNDVDKQQQTASTSTAAVVGKSNRRSLISCCWEANGERVIHDYDEHLGEGRQYWRDIILGVNDGLVSTFLLIAGVVGANLSNTDILLTALSGTIAGAISMAAGEYVATKTQTEVMDGEIALERKHISKNRDFELAELKEAFGIIGIPEEDNSPEVVQLRQHLMKYYATHDEAHLQAHAVLELGVIEEEKRNPFVAGGVAFFLFFFGAMPSVIPFLCTSDITAAFIAAAVCCTTGLLVVGAVKTWATRGNLWVASLENLLIAAGGGSIAYGVGVGFEKVVNG